MTPIGFVLWLNGAAELVGDQPPTPEQWATMREKLGEAVGGIVAARLLERAEETLRDEERRKKEEVAKAEAMKQALSGYQARVDSYRHRIEMEAAKLLGSVPTVPAFEAPKMPKFEAPKMPKFEAPKMPKLRSPGFLNLILGKTTT